MATSERPPNQSLGEFDLRPPESARYRQLVARLTPAERAVLLEHSTETPFCGRLLHNRAAGVCCCKLCGLPLFRSGEKFEFGDRLAELQAPIDERHLRFVRDTRSGMGRGTAKRPGRW